MTGPVEPGRFVVCERHGIPSWTTPNDVVIHAATSAQCAGPATDRPPHATCVEITTHEDRAAGRRRWMCGMNCPDSDGTAPGAATYEGLARLRSAPDPARDARREAYAEQQRRRAARALDRLLDLSLSNPLEFDQRGVASERFIAAMSDYVLSRLSGVDEVFPAMVADYNEKLDEHIKSSTAHKSHYGAPAPGNWTRADAEAAGYGHVCESPAACWGDPECPVYSSKQRNAGHGASGTWVPGPLDPVEKSEHQNADSVQDPENYVCPPWCGVDGPKCASPKHWNADYGPARICSVHDQADCSVCGPGSLTAEGAHDL